MPSLACPIPISPISKFNPFLVLLSIKMVALMISHGKLSTSVMTMLQPPITRSTSPKTSPSAMAMFLFLTP